MSSEIELVVVFCDSSVAYWWNRFLKPGYQHVFALTPVEDRQGKFWLCLSPSVGYTDVQCARWGPIDAVINENIRDYRWLHIRAKRDSGVRAPHLLQPFTCVEQVKALAGIGAPWVLTPWQLRKYVDGPASRNGRITTIDSGRSRRGDAHGAHEQNAIGHGS